MINIKGKFREAIDKAIAGNVDMRSLLALLGTIGVLLACIAGFLAIMVIIFLPNIGGVN